MSTAKVKSEGTIQGISAMTEFRRYDFVSGKMKPSIDGKYVMWQDVESFLKEVAKRLRNLTAISDTIEPPTDKLPKK